MNEAIDSLHTANQASPVCDMSLTSVVEFLFQLETAKHALTAVRIHMNMSGGRSNCQVNLGKVDSAWQIYDCRQMLFKFGQRLKFLRGCVAGLHILSKYI
jgi:hypothetical protein